MPSTKEGERIDRFARQQRPLRRLLNGLPLGFRLLIATMRYQRRYPLTATALRSAFLRLLDSVWFEDFESSFLITRAQIDWFVAGGWDYTERRLQLLQQTNSFPISGDGVEMLMDLRQRMEGVHEDSFEQALAVIYQDPVYPIYQHVSQAFRNHVTGRQPFVLEVLSSLDPVPCRLCDVGCGAGILLGDVLEQYPQVWGYGVDVSHVMLDHARRVLRAWHLDGRATLVNGDLRRLSFPGDTFDFVMAMETLEHLPDPPSGVGELARLLAPGGCLVTSIPVQCTEPGHLHVFGSVGEVVEMHRLAGLVVERQRVAELAPGVANVMLAARKRR